ncbi:F-box domain containing protein [Tanacetum coccineum]
MIHLVIHFPLEALEGGPIRPRWMFPFERYMKKLKGYVRNKAKPEGSIAEGYVVEEALTFSSHYFRDVTTKFNRPNHNVDPPPPTYDDITDDEDAHFLLISRCQMMKTTTMLLMMMVLTKFILVKKKIDLELCMLVPRLGDGEVAVRDRPPLPLCTHRCWGCFANLGKGKRKLNLGGRVAGRLNTHDKTRNLSLKEITDKKGPVPIRFELRDKQTLMPLGDHAAHWSSYIGEVIRGVPLYYSSWLKVPKERKAALITNIGTQFDLRPHMESPDWTEINAGIQQHLQKAYNTNKAAFKAHH